MSLPDLFCHVDDFCQQFVPEWEKQPLQSQLCAYVQSCYGYCTGISFIDSTPIAVCHQPKKPSLHRVPYPQLEDAKPN